MTDREKLDFLLGVYFRTQAAIERYMGRENLPSWTEHMAATTAESIRESLPAPADQARRVVSGLEAMLDIYGSETTMSESDGEVRLDVHRCGIFDYRERAREQGVELTLPTPCEFCVDLRRRTAKHLGVPVSHELRHRGCTYTSRTPEATDGR
jgi:hypothetical protein